VDAVAGGMRTTVVHAVVREVWLQSPLKAEFCTKMLWESEV
jgi:hypothetical protein